MLQLFNSPAAIAIVIGIVITIASYSFTDHKLHLVADRDYVLMTLPGFPAFMMSALEGTIAAIFVWVPLKIAFVIVGKLKRRGSAPTTPGSPENS